MSRYILTFHSHRDKTRLITDIGGIDREVDIRLGFMLANDSNVVGSTTGGTNWGARRFAEACRINFGADIDMTELSDGTAITVTMDLDTVISRHRESRIYNGIAMRELKQAIENSSPRVRAYSSVPENLEQDLESFFNP